MRKSEKHDERTVEKCLIGRYLQSTKLVVAIVEYYLDNKISVLSDFTWARHYRRDHRAIKSSTWSVFLRLVYAVAVKVYLRSRIGCSGRNKNAKQIRRSCRLGGRNVWNASPNAAASATTGNPLIDFCTVYSARIMWTSWSPQEQRLDECKYILKTSCCLMEFQCCNLRVV